MFMAECDAMHVAVTLTSISPLHNAADRAKFVQLIGQFDPNAWPLIADALPGRRYRQCRQRVCTCLCWPIPKIPWMASEDELLFHKKVTREVSKRFESRSP
jgi:hypothetical protein